MDLELADPAQMEFKKTLKLIEKRVERGREVHLVFIDLQKGYDTVNKLWPAMKNIVSMKSTLTVVKILYCGNKSYIKMGENTSKKCIVSKGPRQGCSLAPPLKIYVEEALKIEKKMWWNRSANREFYALYSPLRR